MAWIAIRAVARTGVTDDSDFTISNQPYDLGEVIDLKFGNFPLGTYTLAPTKEIDLPKPVDAGPFNQPDRFRACIHRTSIVLAQSNLVNAYAAPWTSKFTLINQSGDPAYTVDYRVASDPINTTFALIIELSNAVIAFVVRVFLAVINYFRSLGFLVSQPFRRSDDGDDRID